MAAFSETYQIGIYLCFFYCQ